MARLEARIEELEAAIAPPEAEDLLALRRRQAQALDEWAQAQADRLGISLMEFERRQWHEREQARHREGRRLFLR